IRGPRAVARVDLTRAALAGKTSNRGASMHKLMLRILFVIAVGAVMMSVPVSAATLSPALSAALPALPDSASLGVVVIAFATTSGLRGSDLHLLRSLGIAKGLTFERLGIVGARGTAGQVRSLAASPAVRSVWSNDRLTYYNNQTRVLCGVDRVRTDPAFTRANGGLPVSGAGNFSVVINDS